MASSAPENSLEWQGNGTGKLPWEEKRISFPRKDQNGSSSTSRSSTAAPVAEKGRVVVYTVDQKRYSFPIAYLNNYIFRELLIMAEEEFGLPSDIGPITIPCEDVVMDYLMALIQREATKDVEEALLLSISSSKCSSSYRETPENSLEWQGNSKGKLPWEEKESFLHKDQNESSSSCSSTAPVAEKGHVVVYTADHKRYSFPIAYLNNYIFRELLIMVEEEFGVPIDGPITIPCEAVFMDYLISLVQRGATKYVEEALLLSISSSRCSSFYTEIRQHQPPLISLLVSRVDNNPFSATVDDEEQLMTALRIYTYNVMYHRIFLRLIKKNPYEHSERPRHVQSQDHVKFAVGGWEEGIGPMAALENSSEWQESGKEKQPSEEKGSHYSKETMRTQALVSACSSSSSCQRKASLRCTWLIRRGTPSPLLTFSRSRLA
ncbi:hypothetical protein M9H77_18006 [Catharanthus roseus]|uniref:Uncharacterized protein n=1 Tax=Catharanthus roseus TaxID=4058 RepID=A0ACC0B6J8_CATRO|nr:hypothetical protein M9H77_18006 [Catharanthus roseus]